MVTKEEKRVYAQGYQAGKKAGLREVRRIDRDALWNEIYLTMLPIAMQCKNWTLDGKEVINCDERIELARVWANQAMGNTK